MNLINEESCEFNVSDNLFSFYCGLVIKNIRKEMGFTASDLAKKNKCFSATNVTL